MRRALVVAGVVTVQLALVGAAVAPQLSARLTGETRLLRVAPVDPIDPFRGAYVDLDYPDLRREDYPGDGRPGGAQVFVLLVERHGVLVADGWTRQRPADGTYLACHDDGGWEVDCGIESWFVPQDRARELEEQLRDSGALAEVRIDSRGNATIVDLRPG